LIPVLLGALRGTLCLYQGEELGLEEAELSYEQIKDPWGKTLWPTVKGRDGCRTPMPWSSPEPHAGFTTGEPWLPIPESHRRRAVDLQEASEGSTLQMVRRYLRWRREQPTLRRGDIELRDVGPEVLAFARGLDDRRTLCLFNLSPRGQSVPVPTGEVRLAAPGVERATDGTLALPAHGWLFAELSSEA
jgi:alpha-glucosidase